MLNVFEKKSAEGMQVQLSDGRFMPLEDLVRDYERLLKEEFSEKTITSETKEEKVIASKLKVGEWFRIDREVIDKNKDEIRRKCNEAGKKGKKLWERFEQSNEIADKNPEQYPQLIETYIFEKKWDYKTQQQMQDMCREIGDGMCCEIICDLELQMRICNGETVEDLVEKYDRLPEKRVIKFRNGDTGKFGGGADHNPSYPPAYLDRKIFEPFSVYYKNTPYAFRLVLS